MKIFGFANHYTLAQNQFGKNADVLGAVLCAALLALRLIFAEEDFSYDYSAYIYYFDLLGDYSFLDLIQQAGNLFPYVVLPRAPVFEFGFVLLSKAVQGIVQTPAATYASIGALSLGMRVYVMRRLGCSWPWIIVIQLYAATMFEANAIRVGLAVALVLLGLYRILYDQKRSGWFWLFMSLTIHLQAVLFVFPFFAVWRFRARLERSHALLLVLIILMFAAVAAFMASGLLAAHEKLGDYASKESGSAGITITSISAMIFMGCALFFRPNRQEPNQDYGNRLLWTAACVAVVPSVILFATVTSIAALGDRAWQFAFVVIASLVHTNWITERRKVLAGRVLAVIAIMAVINVTLRYPLSNLFDFILPHVYIEGQL
jgi:hypothetical protein